MSRSHIRNILIVLFDPKGVVHKEFAPDREDITEQFYTGVLGVSAGTLVGGFNCNAVGESRQIGRGTVFKPLVPFPMRWLNGDGRQCLT